MSVHGLTFDDLKKRNALPEFNTWDLYPKGDVLGRLNLIGPDSVKRGRDAIKLGIRVNLNLPLNLPPINPGRGCMVHKIVDQGYYYDDEISGNTQCSSQWDGFLHVPYQNFPEKGEYRYYGNTQHKEVLDTKNSKYGTHNFAVNPITSRAHLLDIVAYRKRHNLPPLEPLGIKTPVSLDDLKGATKDAGIEFAPGDILLVRSGMDEAIINMDEEVRKTYDPMHGAVGVDATEEVMRWHWDNGIAAVAGDAFAYEFWPPNLERGRCIHEVFLSGWGIPLGELWDLRELAEKCAKHNQYTFMLTSMTLNIEGGIGSPSNAQAIL